MQATSFAQPASAAAEAGSMPAIAFPDHPFTPQLGWSSTRSETFRSCRRRYFFQYHARYDSEWPLAQIQRLKSLSSIPMLVGEAVHDIVASLLRRLLRSAAPIDRDRFRRHVRQTLEAAHGRGSAGAGGGGRRRDPADAGASP